MFILGIPIAFAAAFLLWFFAIRPALRGRPALPPIDTICEILDRSDRSLHHDCGHQGPTAFKIRLWGEGLLAFSKEDGPNKLCAECILAMLLRDTTRCAICGAAIMPGEPVALVVDTPNFRKRLWRKIIDGQVVCCMGLDCETGPEFVGHWTREGTIDPAFPEGRTMLGHSFATGQAVHVRFGKEEEK